MTDFQVIQEAIMQAIEKHDHSSEVTPPSIRVIDLREVRRRHELWTWHMSPIQPFYAIKSNRDSRVCDALAALGAGFNCSTPGDLIEALGRGCAPENITLTHPYKSRALLRLARTWKAGLIAFDTVDELDMIRDEYPTAKLLLRLATSPRDQDPMPEFGVPVAQAMDFLKAAECRQLEVVGLIVHCEANELDPASFRNSLIRALRSAGAVFQKATSLGLKLSVVDIGGGFCESGFTDTANVVQEVLRQCFPQGTRFIAEPGRFFVDSAVTIASCIDGTRSVPGGAITQRVLCVNDTVFDNFARIILAGGAERELHPEAFRVGGVFVHRDTPPKSATFEYTIRGSSLYTIDKIVDMWVSDLALGVGDWLIFRNLGAYSMSPDNNQKRVMGDSTLHYVE